MLFSKIPAYLIDSENVGSTWTNLLQNDEKFELYICVTENAKSLNFSLLKELTEENRRKINIIECEPGKNSLDFYLSSYLGYLIGKGKHSSYIVVSQDTGYDHVIEYWKKEGYDVSRINTKPETKRRSVRKKATERKASRASTSAINSETRIITKKDPEPVRKKSERPLPVSGSETKDQDLLKQLLKDYSENEIEGIRKVLDGVDEDKREDKNLIYNELVRRYKKKKGPAIYTLLKKDLKNYYRLSEKGKAVTK